MGATEGAVLSCSFAILLVASQAGYLIAVQCCGPCPALGSLSVHLLLCCSVQSHVLPGGDPRAVESCTRHINCVTSYVETLQETVADELEEGYRGEIWNPARGHAQPQKQGVTAARIELRTLVNECKVRKGEAALTR